MKPWIAVVIGCCSAVAGYVVHLQVTSSEKVSAQSAKLHQIEMTVQKNMQLISSEIESKLASFAEAVAEDRFFSLRLLGEQDRSSPDVTQFAAKFMKPMGFSVLDIVDSSYVVVSSGAFIASVGGNASEKISALGKNPDFYKDKIMGEMVLTFQAKKNFRIADIPFYVLGGCRVDKNFLKRLAPDDRCSLFLKSGEEIIGNDTIRTVSDLKNHKIIINDKEYDAAVIPLASGTSTSPQLVVYF
ncbi:MAG TPA: hypothetical protein VHO70_07465 [Chitinispirillaceae bacterium]|nr:hypothetical protein [Chitinispirillaceae bacterium]